MDPDWVVVCPCGFDIPTTLREMDTLEAKPWWCAPTCAVVCHRGWHRCMGMRVGGNDRGQHHAAPSTTSLPTPAVVPTPVCHPGMLTPLHRHALRAHREGQVVVVDGNQMFNRPGPRLVDALEFLVGLLHNQPDIIPDDFPWQRYQLPALEQAQQRLRDKGAATRCGADDMAVNAVNQH